ncbi:MAG: substrate-binding domain-containing protein [Lachnospiraceae bacterium]|nr:substrate-binding domain-containing protein [Lachnospiraceae bacterium]
MNAVRKACAILAGILLISTLLLGCGKEPEQKEEAKEPGRIRIGMSFDSFVVERWQRDRDVFVSTASDLGADVNVQNANGDAAEQVNQIRRFIEQGVDVIVVVPIDPTPLKDVVAEAKDAGIPLISYDRLISDTPTDLYISFDNVRVGELMGKAMSKALHKGDKVLMICGPETDGNVSLVRDGFVFEMKRSGISILDTTYIADWNAALVEPYLNEHMDLVKQADGIMCGNDNLAGEVTRILSEQRLTGKIRVVGQDAELEACQRIVEGTQLMTVYKPVELLAKRAAEIAVKMAKGEGAEDFLMLINGHYAVPYLYLDPLAVTAENIDATVIDSGFHRREDIYLERPHL